MILAIPFTLMKQYSPSLPWWGLSKQRTRRGQSDKARLRSQSIFKRHKLAFKWLLRLCLLLLAVDILYLALIWPSWDKFKQGPIAKSAFIKTYEQQRRSDKSLPPLQWQPVRMAEISAIAKRMIIVAEDSRFYQHSGFDLIALREAMGYNIERMSMKYGASTISQQVIKNMFFSPSRNPLRKWHELIFTIGMELSVPKHRILATYLNIAEFGPGIYGVEAAAKHYWGISASVLNLQQAVELAASLPSPKKHNPMTRTESFIERTEKIYGYLR